MVQETTLYESAVIGSADWKGTSRYKVLGCLGRGGMGAVYEVLDRERDQAVALKTLLRVDPAGLYRFKQEFRTLADVQHTNLVKLYELVIRESGEIFFTMELVRGTEFVEYTRARAPSSQIVPLPRGQARVEASEHVAGLGGSGGRGSTDSDEMVADRAEVARSGGSGRRVTPADESRLRPALSQLVAGIRALHAAGKLHRDIKPSNALVTEEGRVVLLDFGVATELSNRDRDQVGGEDQEMVGTALYMAPEQADEVAPTPASDWYSVGVMLYEALVGAPPFEGSAIDVITMKATTAAPLPSASVDGVPPDLDALCGELLDIEPDNRPGGEEILRRLGGARSISSNPPVAVRGAMVERDVEFVGRDEPLRTLDEALASAQAGRPVTLFVPGASGMGKTRLVNHFLDGLVAARRALVLRGRCYEREAVPYKAFDAVMDALSRHLMTLLETGEEVALPEDCWLLGRLFPVLQRIPELARMANAPIDNPQAVRRRALSALRELLITLSKRSPVVIFVDDVHWGDADSAALLLELVRPPSPAALLVVMTYQESKEASPFLKDLRERWPTEADQRRLPIGPLSLENALRLALLLTGDDLLAQRAARAVARESQGQPFLIEELVRANRGYIASSGGRTLALLTVDDMIGARLKRLPESARHIAELVAVAGRPVPISVTLRAAGMDANGAGDVVSTVCSRRFARTGLHNGRDVLESTYDQIRERVVAQLDPARLRQHHAALAQALQEAPGRDGEAIAEHWLGAGERDKAAAVAREAAELAFATFAFDHAVRLLRLALDNTPPSSPDVHAIRLRLAQGLQLAGRSTESGREYLKVANTAPPEQKLELRRVAAEQLLAAGRIEEGERILHDVLASCGMRAPRTPMAALFWLVVYSLWIRLRGYGFKERERSAVSVQDRMRVEALYTVGMGFGFVNSILAKCMQTRQCLEALRVGDRTQVLQALATQISHMGTSSPKETERERSLIQTTRELAQRIGGISDHYVDMAVGFTRFMRGQWLTARELLARAETAFRHSDNRVLAANATIFNDNTYFFTGEFPEYVRRCKRLLADAEDRRDLYTMAMLRTAAVARHGLITGDTERARASVREVMAQWPQVGFSVQHWYEMVCVADLDVYEGNGGHAYDSFIQRMPLLKKSLLLGTWFVRMTALHAHGRLAIASIASRPEMRDARVAETRRLAGALAREPNLWAVGLAASLRALAAIAVGDRTAAMAELRETVARTTESNSGGAGTVARYRLGQLLDDEEGRTLVRDAVKIFEEWGVKDIERYVGTIMPVDMQNVRRLEG